jgi:hypothetical protein
MDKKTNAKKTQFYKSTSVLGQIYDMADISTYNLGYSHQGMSTPPCKSLLDKGFLFISSVQDRPIGHCLNPKP